MMWFVFCGCNASRWCCGAAHPGCCIAVTQMHGPPAADSCRDYPTTTLFSLGRTLYLHRSFSSFEGLRVGLCRGRFVSDSWVLLQRVGVGDCAGEERCLGREQPDLRVLHSKPHQGEQVTMGSLPLGRVVCSSPGMKKNGIHGEMYTHSLF